MGDGRETIRVRSTLPVPRSTLLLAGTRFRSRPTPGLLATRHRRTGAVLGAACATVRAVACARERFPGALAFGPVDSVAGHGRPADGESLNGCLLSAQP